MRRFCPESRGYVDNSLDLWSYVSVATSERAGAMCSTICLQECVPTRPLDHGKMTSRRLGTS